MGRPGIVVYGDLLDSTAQLTDEQFGKLIRAAIRYGCDDIVPTFDDAVLTMAWGFMKPKIDLNNAKYDKAIVQKAYAIYCRWAGKDKKPFKVWAEENTDEYGRIRVDTDVYGRIQTKTKTISETISKNIVSDNKDILNQAEEASNGPPPDWFKVVRD